MKFFLYPKYKYGDLIFKSYFFIYSFISFLFISVYVGIDLSLTKFSEEIKLVPFFI